MAEFMLKKEATRSPTECAICKRHVGPFIDTQLDLPVYGHIWICVGDEDRPGCAVQMGRLAGMLDGSYADKLRLMNAQLKHDNERLLDSIDTGPVLVAREDLEALLKPKRTTARAR